MADAEPLGHPKADMVTATRRLGAAANAGLHVGGAAYVRV